MKPCDVEINKIDNLPIRYHLVTLIQKNAEKFLTAIRKELPNDQYEIFEQLKFEILRVSQQATIVSKQPFNIARKKMLVHNAKKLIEKIYHTMSLVDAMEISNLKIHSMRTEHLKTCSIFGNEKLKHRCEILSKRAENLCRHVKNSTGSYTETIGPLIFERNRVGNLHIKI